MEGESRGLLSGVNAHSVSLCDLLLNTNYSNTTDLELLLLIGFIYYYTALFSTLEQTHCAHMSD